MQSAGTAIAYPNPRTKVTYTYPGAVIQGVKGPLHVGPPTGVQCDSDTSIASTKKPGCVYYNYMPTYVIDYNGSMPNIAQNILFAELSLDSRPGFPGTDTTLAGQYLVRGPQQVKDPKTGKMTDFSGLSRAVACPSSLPRPTGQSCDEYPFASTWQGAEWVSAAEWSCRMVPDSENNTQGGDLTKFFDENRLQRNPDGGTIDPSKSRLLGAFWVTVSNAPNSPPSFDQCQKHL